MDHSEKIKSILRTTKRVFEDCVFPGGAIVASNSFQAYSPKDAKNYKFVWPRDGAFICYAADILDMDISTDFYNWCMKAEAWEQKGVFYEKYFISGKQAAHNFQPDQTGELLWSVCHHIKEKKKSSNKLERLVVKTADGICKIWNKDHFCGVTEDVWEERHCFPDMKENFTFSLASVYKGLMMAYNLYEKKQWKETAQEMAQTLNAAIPRGLGRSFGMMDDLRPDASLLGLVWPFPVEGMPLETLNDIIASIENKLVIDFGVHRYEHDEYDGWMYNKNISRRKGSGYWPLLNFWMTVALLRLGEKEKAVLYFNKVLDVLKDDFIPEQIFNNPYQVSVSPLCWSHAMFVVACRELGFI
jgi:GH15 family glucan-1,4-alpha-glucosidase